MAHRPSPKKIINLSTFFFHLSNKVSYNLIKRYNTGLAQQGCAAFLVSYSSAYTSPSPSSPVPAHQNFLVGTGHGSFPAVAEATTTKGEGMVVAAAGGDLRGRCRRGTLPASRSVESRSKAYRIFGEMYACAYVLVMNLHLQITIARVQ